MNPSRTKVVTTLRQRLLNTPLYRPARFLYNRILLFRARRTVTLNGVSVEFWTPTFKLVEDFDAFAEKEILSAVLDALRDGDTVWDVGANVGLFTLFAAHAVGSSGHVVAFEPEPRTRQLLQRNTILNRFHNVTVVGSALDKVNVDKILYPSDTPNPGTHSLVQRRDYKLRPKGKVVRARRGDTLARELNLKLPNVMKIDVEGGEYDVLSGLGDILHSPALRMLVVEVHPVVLPLFNAGAHDVENLLRSATFSRIDRKERGAEYHLLCYRP